ncbi:MAG: hypothetical protein GF330_00650 [Candidatus Eisenbacteria bacterium]|nr:hypothetical protein [Candidatus Eisenbacteria bacterium]
MASSFSSLGCALLVLLLGSGTLLAQAQEPTDSESELPGTALEMLVVEPDGAAAQHAPADQQVSIAAREADLRAILLALAEQAGLDLIADPDVGGTVTLEIENVKLTDALDAILTPSGYPYELRGALLQVYGRGMQTRVFKLDYMTSVRSGLTRLSASSGGGAGGGSASSGAGSGGQESSSGESNFSVDSEMFSAPWQEIIRGLELIVFGEVFDGLGAPSDRPEQLVVHPASGVILVTASLPTLNRVAAFLEEIDGAVHRQVVIGVRLLEVALRDGFQMGIDWSRVPNAVPAAAGDLTEVFGHDDAAIRQSLNPQNQVFQIAGSAGEFTGLLDALETQGRVKMISAPTVVTLNNQKAIIKVAREESFFSQRIDYLLQADGTAQPISSVEAERITIGLILDVTPQISRDAEIMMHIHPSLTELVGEDVFPPGADGSEVQANAPILDIREIDTVVEIASGNRLIIGGLMKNRISKQEKRVPLLGWIPLIGYLFKQADYVEEQIELVVVLEPRIVVGSEATQLADQELARLERLYRR